MKLGLEYRNDKKIDTTAKKDRYATPIISCRVTVHLRALLRDLTMIFGCMCVAP